MNRPRFRVSSRPLRALQPPLRAAKPPRPRPRPVNLLMPELAAAVQLPVGIGDCEGLWDSRPGREHIPDEKQTNGWICCARCGLLLLVIFPTGLPEGQPSASGRRETKET